MYCTQCGVGLPRQAKFCAECGAAVIARLPGHESPSFPVRSVDSETAVAEAEVAGVGGPEHLSTATMVVPSSVPTTHDKGIGEHSLPWDSEQRGTSAAIRQRAMRRTQTLTRVYVGVSAIFVVYCLVAARPLAFLVRLPEAVGQELLTASVVAVICESTMTGEVSKGSGTMLADAGVVLTNSHVIPQDETSLHVDDDGCIVTIPDPDTGQIREEYWAQPVVYPELSDEYDLAYLRIKAPVVNRDGVSQGVFPKKFHTFLSADDYTQLCVGTAAARLGDPLRIFGYPSSSGLNLTVTEGIASSLLEDGRILTSAKLDAGNSGGLVVDRRGCFLGVPSAVAEGVYENLGIVISAKQVDEFSVKVSESSK